MASPDDQGRLLNGTEQVRWGMASVDDTPVIKRALLRFLGLMSGLGWRLSLVRYWFMPLNWLFAAMAIIGWLGIGYDLVGVLRQPNPQATTISQVAVGTERAKYVTLTGTPDYEVGYEGKQDGESVSYYALIDGPQIIFVKDGRRPNADGSISGRLAEPSAELQSLIEKDVREAGMQGQVVSNYYLDPMYKPTPPLIHLIGLVIVGFGALGLIYPALRQYGVFDPRQEAPSSPEQPLEWPLPASVTGMFYGEDGSHTYQVRANAVLDSAENSEASYVIRTRFVSKRDPKGVVHAISLYAGSEAQWGFDYGGGRPRPCVVVRGRGVTTRIIVDEPAAAYLLAQALSR